MMRLIASLFFAPDLNCRLQLFPRTELSDILSFLYFITWVLSSSEISLDAVIKKDEQVYNRFRACHRFGKLSGNDFADAVNIWEKEILKLPVASNLTGKRIMKVLGEATGGYIGLLDMVLREAAIRALKKGMSKIDLATLKEVAGEYK